MNAKSPKRTIPLARPDLTEREVEAVVRVLRTPRLSLGPALEAFERKLAEVAGVKHAVAVNSGTSALHLCVKALGVGEGDEVITTPFSFIASANCILFERAKPVFVDIDPKTLNLDPELVETAITSRTRAILAVDVFGHPAEWDALTEIARRHNLKLIEDAAEALGAAYKGRPAGSFGDAAVFAFYPNKQITTGEGGAVLTDRDEVAQLCRSLRNQGRAEGSSGGWLRHERLGYNYRLSDVNCALGLAQLERLDELLARRERVAQLYNERLEPLERRGLLQRPYVAPYVKMSWFVYVVRLDERFTQRERDCVIEKLRAQGVECADYFPPIHLQPVYRALGYKPGAFPVTEAVAQRTVALPFHTRLTPEDVECVVAQLEVALESL